MLVDKIWYSLFFFINNFQKVLCRFLPLTLYITIKCNFNQFSSLANFGFEALFKSFCHFLSVMREYFQSEITHGWELPPPTHKLQLVARAENVADQLVRNSQIFLVMQLVVRLEPSPQFHPTTTSSNYNHSSKLVPLYE